MIKNLIISIFLTHSLSFAAALELKTEAKQAIITDYYTGKVLFELDADKLMHPSSMTKIMTVYMAFEKLKKKIINLNSTVLISNKAYKMGGSRMFIDPKVPVSIEDLLKGIIVVSGNDASVALAEALAGSEEVFAAQMTQRAREMGCTNTTFRNSSGWPDPEHLTTARDLDLILRHLIKDFPEYHDLFSLPQFTYNNITQYNRHPLFEKNIGCDVGKTGFTDSGQYGLVASAQEIDHQGHRKRINVVINGLSSAKDRATTAMNHMVWALKNFSTIPVAKKDEALTTITIKDGVEKSLTLAPITDIFATLPSMDSQNIKTDFIIEPTISAPIKIGQILGKALINVPSYEKPLEVDLVATKDIARAGFFSRMLNVVAGIFRQQA
jgi:D-alanyl-D-alanine carboxypeptidase (penicillin-binding protein 5/6)